MNLLMIYLVLYKKCFHLINLLFALLLINNFQCRIIFFRNSCLAIISLYLVVLNDIILPWLILIVYQFAFFPFKIFQMDYIFFFIIRFLNLILSNFLLLILIFLRITIIQLSNMLLIFQRFLPNFYRFHLGRNHSKLSHILGSQSSFIFSLFHFHISGYSFFQIHSIRITEMYKQSGKMDRINHQRNNIRFWVVYVFRWKNLRRNFVGSKYRHVIFLPFGC